MTNNRLFSHSHGCRAMLAMTILLLMLFFTTLGNAQLVKDINVGATGSNPNSFVAVGNKAIFIADDANINGRKVYQSDGTTAGTVPVPRYSGTVSDYALTAWNGQAYFITSVNNTFNTFNSILLYRTNGSTTALVDTLISGNPQTTQYSAVITVINNQLYYSLSRIGFRDSDVNLYAHNGQRNGSKIITTTGRTVGSSGGSFGTTISKVFYGTNAFYLSSESSGSSPFITREVSVVRNTTPTSTPKVLNTTTFSTLTGQTTGNPVIPLETIGDLFYGVNQDSLFRFDSTGVKTLIKTGVGTFVSYAQKLGNVIYFASNGNRLWKTDGTAAGTVQVDIFAPSEPITAIISQNNSIYVATTGNGILPALWKLSSSGTGLTLNNLTLIATGNEGSFYNYFAANGKLYWFYGDTFGGFSVFEEGPTLAQTRTIYATGAPGSSTTTGNGTVTANGLLLLALDNRADGLGTELWKANVVPTALPDLTIKLLDVKLSNPFDNYNFTVPYRTTLDIKYQVATTQFIPTSVGVNNTFTAYVSRDANLSADDVNLGAAYQPAQTDSLAIRLTYNGVSSQILFYGSESLTTGQYYLILVVDSPNRIPESNENNNVSNAIPFMYYRQTCNSSSNAPWDLWISNVNFNTISNPSGQIRNFPLGGFTKGYTNFIDKNTTISTGSSYPLSITRSTSWTANPAAVYTRAWIDYNGDGDYLDAGEMVLQGNAPSSQVVFGNVVVPTTAQIGFTTMRISSKFTAYAAPCDSFDIGEVEDYGITIQAGTVSQLPDFTLANLVLRDPSVLAGTNINFTLDAKNIGAGNTTSPLGYKVYLSVDQTFGVNDVQVGSSNLPTLSSGQTITGLSGSASSTGFTGTYYIIVKVDADNTIAESNENNNVIVSTTTVTIRPVVVNQPDLVLKGNLNGRIQSNQFILNAPIFLKNIGTGSVTSDFFKINFYLSTDAVLSANDVAFGSLQINFPTTLAAGDSAATSPNSFSFGNILPGTYYVIAKADGDDQIVESSETNNTLASALQITIPPIVNNSCRYQDSLQLVSLYNATGGANWAFKWNLATPINTWNGVTLNANGCVEGIQLSVNNLVGTFPNLSLSALKSINFSGNKLTGAIPSLISLPILENLILSNNQLTGVIPNFNLPNLNIIILYGNQLSGVIPNFNLPNLVSFDAHLNNLTGAIPNFNLPKIVNLFLDNNLLTGLPNFNAMPSLSILQLNYNQLTGTIPSFTLPALTNLSLSFNKLTGTIPSFNLPSLQALIIDYNPITTALPNFNLPELTYLSLINNGLTGTIPNFNLLPKLNYLSMGRNNFTGSIPNFNLPELTYLNLYNNNLTGNVPNFNLPKLAQFQFVKNKLTGSIPNFNLGVLKRINLDSNTLSGCIPVSLKTFCGVAGAFVSFNANPSLATQDFAAFCANNTGACATPLPDFRVTNIEESSPLFSLANRTFRGGLDGFPVLVTVVNDGAATASVLTTSVYISADTLLDSRDSLLGTPLQSSGVGAFVIGGRLPYYADGDYYIIAKTNSNNAIPESNPNNNTFVLKTPKVKIRNSGIVDADISINSSLGAYTQFAPIAYRITAYNRGTSVLTNVKVEFKFPAKTVSGGTATPSKGTWQEWCSGGIQCFTWTIPSLAVDEIANLDVPIYVLGATGPLVATAKLLSSTPTDLTPINNTATRTIDQNLAPTTQPLAFQVPTQLVPVVIQRISPNPTEGDVQVKLDSWTKQEVDFNFSDITGKTIHSEKRQLDKGVNKVDFDLYSLPQGVYFIQTNVGKGTNVPTKFVKM